MRSRSIQTLVLTLAALLGLACQGTSTAAPERLSTEPAGGAVAFATILEQSFPGQGGATVREAIRDQAAWTAFWKDLGGGETPPPAVDFSRDMVIAAAMETQSCVSKVTIRGIAQGRGELVVDLLEAPPAPNCTCIVAERPVHIVRLAKSADPVRFDVTRGQTSCG